MILRCERSLKAIKAPKRPVFENTRYPGIFFRKNTRVSGIKKRGQVPGYSGTRVPG